MFLLMFGVLAASCGWPFFPVIMDFSTSGRGFVYFVCPHHQSTFHDHCFGATSSVVNYKFDSSDIF